MAIEWIIAWIITNIISFFVGQWTERAKTERKLKKAREQILILSNRSASIEDRYKKLLLMCAYYDLTLQKASKSKNKEVRELKNEFVSISNLLEEAGLGRLERWKIKAKLLFAKRTLQAEAAHVL